jgi:hypothetical protein
MRVQLDALYLASTGSGYGIGLDDAGHAVEFQCDWLALSPLYFGMREYGPPVVEVETEQIVAVDEKLRVPLSPEAAAERARFVQAALVLHDPSGANQERRSADPGREKTAARFMADGMEPGEWAARNAQNILLFSLHEYGYLDPALDQWVQELGRILFTPGAVEEARKRYLTDEERRIVEEREQEPW